MGEMGEMKIFAIKKIYSLTADIPHTTAWVNAAFCSAYKPDLSIRLFLNGHLRILDVSNFGRCELQKFCCLLKISNISKSLNRDVPEWEVTKLEVEGLRRPDFQGSLESTDPPI
jgi:hypothetical protein